MEIMKKYKKLIITLIFILGILISTQVKADMEFYQGELPIVDHHLVPFSKDGFWLYCIGRGQSLSPSMGRGYTNGSVAGGYCDGCNPGSAPWYGPLTTAYYRPTGRIAERNHQDAAFILANGGLDTNTANAIWSTDLNVGTAMDANELGKEGGAYKTYYVSTHSGDTDIYDSLVLDNTDVKSVKVGVNQTDKTYVVGPFNVKYPSGTYDGINKWSWINNITLLDQNGVSIGDTVTKKIEILDKAGRLSQDTDKDGNILNSPKNGDDFYIRFIVPEGVTNVKFKVGFGYLESVSAELYQIDGTYQNWVWDRENTGREDHGSNKHHSGWVDDDGTVHSGWDEWIPNWKDKYQFRLRKYDSGASVQRLLGLRGPATPIYKQTLSAAYPKTPDKGIDITMNIKGKVFIDKDEGKTNTGNSSFDGGEQLEGVDVWLYDANGTKLSLTLTDSNGNYQFMNLDAQKKYYVRFGYNGMLYTNVEYRETGANNSKATEEAQGHGGNRNNFNNKFSQISSYPTNYKIENKVFGNDLGDYNKVFRQEEVADIFKQVSRKIVENGGDENAAYRAVAGNSTEMKQKVQFVADCRISAYTVTKYPRIDIYTIERTPQLIAGKVYQQIYPEQEYVNLGIKNRPTFDIALYKDAYKAEVVVNEKSETYVYDERKGNSNGFSIGVSESDYLNGLRGKYLSSSDYTNNEQTRALETDKYDLNMRTEEVANGQSKNYKQDVTGKVNGDYEINYEYDNLKTKQQELNNDRLKIYITYKIAVRNQSGIVGAATEIVDYYDTNYEYVNSYVGDSNGNKLSNVTKSDNSMYANSGNNMYKSKNGTYKTMYLRPDQETRLDNDHKEQYIYVTMQLLGPDKDAGSLLSQKLLDNKTLDVINLAEINGYKTYNGMDGDSTPGLIDIDSNPGNLDITDIRELTDDNIKNYPNIRAMYEDDTSRAPAFIYKLMESRTLEGKVFEDAVLKESTKQNQRFGNGKLDKDEIGINGAIVELVEIKNGQMIVRSIATTNADGWYGFTGFLPGNYTIRYTYGSDNNTAMIKKTPNGFIGLNDLSYNGQDFSSTNFGIKQEDTKQMELEVQTYRTDDALRTKYDTNNKAKNNEEKNVVLPDSTVIDKYNKQGFYWYTQDDLLSDARDDELRKAQVIEYSKSEYAREITNHKAEVFNAYVTPQPNHITKEVHKVLVDELERRAYRYAYTAEMPIEVEYAKQIVGGNYKEGEAYVHKIVGVDFGIVERPKAKLELTKNVSHIKVTASDGNTVLYDTDKAVNNLSWSVKKDRYKKVPPILVTMDDELVSGAKLEITYTFTVKNVGEVESDTTTRAEKIVDYVANNLTYTKEDKENNLWQVVNKEDIQNDKKSTLINNTDGKNKLKLIDLSTKSTILQTTDKNPLTKALKPGESTSATLVLKKVLSAESATDDLTYNNIAEIIEVDNTVGRYEHTSLIPGNQLPEEEPTQDDTYKSEIVTIVPPFGSKMIYYVIGITSAVILAAGIYLIKKKVIDKKQ